MVNVSFAGRDLRIFVGTFGQLGEKYPSISWKIIYVNYNNKILKCSKQTDKIFTYQTRAIKLNIDGTMQNYLLINYLSELW